MLPVSYTHLLLLVLTIHIFRKEQTRRNSLRQDEHELACIRHLAGETYAGLSLIHIFTGRRSVIPVCTYPPILHIIRGSWTSPVQRRWTGTMTWKRYVIDVYKRQALGIIRVQEIPNFKTTIG